MNAEDKKISSTDRLIELLLLQHFMEKEEDLLYRLGKLPRHMHSNTEVENLENLQLLKRAQIERLKELKIL